MRGHIRQRGKDSWQLKLDLGGRDAAGKRRTEFHTFHGTKREAQNRLAELIAAAGKGAYVPRSTVTVAEHITERINTWQQRGDIGTKTSERYFELAANQITPHLGAHSLQQLKTADIERWHATLKTSGRKDGSGGLSALTIRHAHRLLSKALKEAARHDLVVRNVANDGAPPRVKREEIVILTADEMRMVVTRLRGHALYPRAIVALFTGLRRSEILALRWGRVDLDARLIKVREAIEETNNGQLSFKEPKTQGSVRDVTLPDIVVETLREHRREQASQRLALGLGRISDDTLVFARLDGAPASPRSFTKEWRSAATAIGAAVSLHALRHTHVSQLIAAGIDIVRISKRLGHANVSTTLDVYSHLFAAREDKSAAAINAAVSALFSG
jgi:integrase